MILTFVYYFKYFLILMINHDILRLNVSMHDTNRMTIMETF